MKVAEALVKILEKADIGVVFGVPGKWISPVYIALSESKIKHILMRHEQAAAHAADGYARITGKPGVCIATAGPGALGLVLGVATAYKDHIPLLTVTGQVPLKLKGKRVTEEFNLVSVFKHITKMSIEIVEPIKAYEQIFSALHATTSGCPAPVHISIPEDVQLRRTEVKEISLKKTPTTVEPDILDLVSNMINNSEKPLILAGQGVVFSRAEKELYEFAKKTKIPIVTTLMARGVISEDDSLNLGFVGYYGNIEANRALAESDLILALGCSLSYNTVFHIEPKAKIIIQVDIDERSFNKQYATLTIKSDVKCFLIKMIRKIKSKSKLWIRGGKQEYKVITGKGFEIAKTLSKMFDKDTVFVLDIGQHTLWSISTIKAYRPRTIIFPGNMATLGYSLPASIGVKAAKPNLNVVAIMGDGAFYASSTELAVLKQFNIPIAIIVYNDKHYGLTKRFQEKMFKKSFGVYLGEFSCAKIAKAYGIKAHIVRSVDELKELDITNIDEPVLVEIILEN